MIQRIFSAFVMIAIMACSAQKSTATIPEYIAIDYTSICCGTPSNEPVMNFIASFSKRYKISTPKIFKQSGLGREGEHKLLVDIGGMKKEQKTDFITLMVQKISKQNDQRKENQDGFVHFQSETLSQKDFEELSKNSRNPIVEIKIN